MQNKSSLFNYAADQYDLRPQINKFFYSALNNSRRREDKKLTAHTIHIGGGWFFVLFLSSA
jgi:hypothetical protein